MKIFHKCAVLILLILQLCHMTISRPSNHNPIVVDEDTIVPLDEDDYTVESVRRKRSVPSVLSEIMGAYSRKAVINMDEFSRSDAVYARMRSLHRILSFFVGYKGPRVEIRQFLNWDKTILIDHVFYVRPITIFQVRSVIRAARMVGLRVRATGAGHTRTPLYTDEGHIMMDVRGLQRHDGPQMELHAPTSERPFHTVTAMTGVYEYDLNAFLVKNGVSMLSQPLNVNETVGGMVAASTHGSTWSAPTWSGYVVEMRLMDARGRLRRFKKERHPEMMKALMANLGMMGIMYDITIRVNGTLIGQVDHHFVTLDTLFYNQTRLREVVTGNFLTEITWYPFNSVTPEEEAVYLHNNTVPNTWSVKRDIIWLRTINLVDAVPAGYQILGPLFLPTGGSLSGGNVTGILRGKGALAIGRKLPVRSYHYLVDAFPVILPPRHGTETSSAFLLNIDNAFDRPTRAFQFMAEKVENQIKSNASSPLNAFLPRFFMNMDCFLCFANNDIKMPDDSGRSLVIDFLAPPTQYGFYPTAADFVKKFRSEKVRPHWAKRHTGIPDIVNILHEVYGENIDKFNEQKFRSGIDLCDMFMNEYLLELFGRANKNYWGWC